MTKTTACFLDECCELNMPVPSKTIETNIPVHISKDRAAVIIQSFKSASRLTFMKVRIIENDNKCIDYNNVFFMTI